MTARLITLSFLTATLTLRATAALAQPSPPPPAEEAAANDSEVIHIEARWPGIELLDADDTTRAISVRRAEQDATTAVAADLLDDLPGVAVQRTGPGQGAPMIRGLIGSSVLVLVDGMRVNNAMFRPAPNQYTALVDPWIVDEVEVTRGPGSTLHGSDAIAGVVNLVTRVPSFSGEHWRRSGTVAVGASSADLAAFTRVEAATGRSDSGVALGTTLQHHGDLRAGGGDMQEPSAYRSLAVDAVGHLERPGHATTAWLQFLEQPSLPRTDEMTAGFGQTEPSAAIFRYQPSRRAFAHLRHLQRRPLPWLDGVELHAAWQRIDDDRRILDTGSTEQLDEQNRNDSLGATVSGSTSLGATLLAAGADYWLDRVGCGRQATDISTGVSTPTGCRFADGSTIQQTGLFALARSGLGDHVRVHAGLRGGLALVRIPAADRPIGASIDAADWAGELGAEVQALPGLAVVGNLGRGFRTPNVHDLSTLGPRPGNRYQVPADGLANEHAFGADVGVRATGQRYAAELFTFGLAYRDRIDVVPTGEVTSDGREIVASQNIAVVDLLGVEGALRVSPWPAIELGAVMTWIRGDQQADDGASEPADRIPPLNGRVWSRWSALAWLDVDAAVRFGAPQHRLSERDAMDPRIDPRGTPGFATFHAGLLARLRSFDIGLQLDNLLDRHYREHASGIDAPGFNASLLLRWNAD
jgi:outer membrane receptor protein involved in Fe transport